MPTTEYRMVLILNRSGVPLPTGQQGDVTIVNQSGFSLFVQDGDPGTPGVTEVIVALNGSVDVRLSPGTDLLAEVKKALQHEPDPFSPPGTLMITTWEYFSLSQANLTQLASALPPGTKPTFFVDVTGSINTISPF